MNIQRFHAPTAREALAKARMTFGDGTLILSNRPVDGGVEVVATAEDSLPPAQPAPQLQPVAQPQRGRLQDRADDLAASPVRSQQAHPGLARSSVAKDAEKLAMSTLSFQDYVRERMLRRRQEALHGGAAAEPQAPWRRQIVPDPVLLFRYSALTFNGHRIHYDRRYVTEVEGYPGLVVHGPLIATLLVDLARRHVPGRLVRRFEFRAVRPTFDLHPFFVSGQPSADGRGVRLWAHDHEGWLTVQGALEFE